jgi:hypothetical protein
MQILSKIKYDEALLKAHRRHAGVYHRVAEQLGVDPSYVSRVATGNRSAAEVRGALLDELHKLQRLLK